MVNKALFSRIVVGADGSDVSQAAIRYAARLARDHDGTLVICNVVDSNRIIAQVAGSGAFIDTTPVIDGMREAGEAILHDAADVVAHFGITAERRLLDADPGDALISLAADERASVIVMGTHGRKGLPRLFIGSTTEAVLRKSVIPVLTVRHAERPDREEKRCIQRVLVGLDDSEPSDAALEVAFDLPEADRRDLLVYSVADIEMYGSVRYYAGYERAQRDLARDIVERAKRAGQSRGISMRSYVLDGLPDRVIVEAAKEEIVDLVVVGSHGRRGLRRFFIGSVAESVVRTSPAPTLVVRTQAVLAHVSPELTTVAHA